MADPAPRPGGAVRPGMLDDPARSGKVGHRLQWPRPCAKMPWEGQGGPFPLQPRRTKVHLNSVELAWWQMGSRKTVNSRQGARTRSAIARMVDMDAGAAVLWALRMADGGWRNGQPRVGRVAGVMASAYRPWSVAS